MTATAQEWGVTIGVETVNGVPYRMYTERPRRVEDLLPLADRWGARPHIIQGDRSCSFTGMRTAVSSKAAELVALGVKRG